MIDIHYKSKDIFIEPFIGECGVDAVETDKGFLNFK